MTIFNNSPKLSFVFRRADINAGSPVPLRQRGVRSIVDLSIEEDDILAECIRSTASTDILLSCYQFLLPGVQDILRGTTSRTIWIEYFTPFPDCNLDDLVAALGNQPYHRLSLITGDIRVIERVFAETPERVDLALKGLESSGFVSPETTLCLVNLVEDLARQAGHSPQVHIWGGIFTAEGAAALLFSGIQSVVFESLHWLTSGIAALHDHQRKRISTLRLDHSTVLPVSSHLCFRAYNKGNSLVINSLARKLTTAAGDTDSSAFVEEILQQRVSVYEAEFTLDELIAIGPEASFADSFVQRFGRDIIEAVTGFAARIHLLLTDAPEARKRLCTGKICAELGSRYPFIQGGMAWISDVPEFALAVAASGALPTIALGVQDRPQLESRFAGIAKLLGSHTFAVNVITLPENPHREAQLEWIKETQAPFVVISAGDPVFGASLQEQGINIIYVTSDLSLLEVAWKAGIRYVVLEGCEAGGHIGSMTTLTLAQAALELRSNHPSYLDKPLILAGGIFSPNTLHRAAILGADAVQMGTVYLTTEEIAQSGALSSVYQNLVLQSAFGATRITGGTTGLRVRSIDSAKIDMIAGLERSMQHDGCSEGVARRKLEEVSVGSLYVAARCRDPLSREAISAERCLQEGQFMSGVVAGNINKTTSLPKLHAQLAESPFQRIPLPAKQPPAATAGTSTPERIAITGMAVSNALGNDADEIWQACIRLQSGITAVPGKRWDHDRYYTENSCHQGRTYCRVAAFQTLEISRKDLGISPHDYRTMTDSTRLTLWLAKRAIEQSGILSSDIARERIGVVVSQNSGETGSTVEDLAISVVSAELAEKIQTGLGLDASSRSRIEDILRAGRICIDDTTLLGRLNCAAGGFICNRYGFTGPSFSVSAACATGLVALYNAVQLINNDILDVAIVGGGEELLHPASFLEFSALGALAGKNRYSLQPAAYSRPFDKNRSGMVLGEGGGLLVLERESVAVQRKAGILAYITGVGASNNHKGMVESIAATQELAIRASFKDTAYGPDQVDMVECHATSTRTGDIEEVKALKAVYPQGCETVLCSLKSQIGHTLGSSGIISLIHGISALQAKTLPPTLNYETPDPELDLESWGFHICKAPAPWPLRNRPGRFQVNAFGFGGANYVVQLEEAGWSPLESKEAAQSPMNPLDQSRFDNSGVTCYRASHAGKDYRLASIGKSAAELQAVLRPYLDNLENLNKLQQRNLGKDGIFLGINEIAPPFALVFAGQGSHFLHMGKQLYHTFATIRQWMDRIASLADFDLLDLMFNSREEDLRKTQWQQPALFVLEYAIYRQLAQFDIQPTALAGHSMGELTALCVAGSFSYEDAFRIINKRAQCMERAGREAVDPGGMIAVDVPEEILREMVELAGDLSFTNFNSPHQTVVGGPTQAIERFKEELDNRNYWNRILPVSMAFHSPIMRIIRNELGDYLEDIEIQAPRIPVISNTTQGPYPDEPAEIKKIIIAHLESPVHWQSNVTTLIDVYQCKLFVEIGPQDTLCRLVADIAPQVNSLYTCSKEMEAETLRRAMAELYALGSMKAPLPPAAIELNAIIATSTQEKLSQPPDTAKIGRIIQREITSFALQGVEKFLKPAILKAIDTELGYACSAADIDVYLGVSQANPLPALTSGGSFLPVQAAESQTPPTPEDPILEKVIGIIIEATGYEREEIEPGMDIRQDLSIRSSRLPVIMDAAEKSFNIVISLEDFLDVRTIGDFSNRVKEVMARQGAQPGASGGPVKIQGMAQPKPAEQRQPPPVRRLVLGETRLEEMAEAPLGLSMADHVAILCLGRTPLGERLSSLLSKNYKCRVTLLALDLSAKAMATIPIKGDEKYSGLIILTDRDSWLESADPISLCTTIFTQIQTMLQSPLRRFCIHLRYGQALAENEEIVAQGVLGILLAAAIEYRSVLFRSTSISTPADALRQGLHAALNTANPAIALNLNTDGLTTHLPTASAAGIAAAAIPLDSDDTIVISGGARGIGAALARSLTGLGCRIILLGRTAPLSATQRDDQTIAGLLAELQADGTPAHYFQCDVTDPKQVQTLAEKLKDFGAISGILHGAGILHDGFIPLLKAADFRKVIEVKLAGLHNLTTHLPTEKLKFVAVLSSLAAISGNVGQASYCCANRMMAAALSAFAKHRQNCLTKTFWLPPIEGAGMAEDADIKAMIKANVGDNAFLHVEEIAEIIIRELRTGDRREQDIIPARELPPQMMVVAMERPEYSAWHSTEKLDMIDGIVQVDWRRKSLLATRTLDHARDLWLKEHQPFPFLKQPITSAVMVVESFLQAASLLAPLSHPLIMEKIHFMKMLPAPLQQKTETFILCREDRKRGIIDCSLGKIDRQADQFSPDDLDIYFNGRVVLSAAAALAFANLVTKFPVLTVNAVNETSLVAGEQMALCYQTRSGLTGRYRVLREINHCDTQSISGKMVYPHLDDFSPPSKNSYQMPVYSLEALLQLAGFHAGLQEKDEGAMVPTTIERLLIVRGCQAGEVIDLQARLINSDDNVATWQTAACGSDGAAILVAEIEMTRMA